MSRYYEEKLPEGYAEALVIDANDKKTGTKMSLIAVISVVVLINVFYFSYARPRMHEIIDSFSVVKIIIFVAAYFVYVVLHELTHGFVYKITTKQKLTFGFKPPAAYCGVPDIYTYRITSLLSLFAPLTVYSIVFILLFFLISDPFSKALILLLFSLHISGCSGDLYSIGLFFSRFKDPSTLRNDSGPKQVYYTKD